MSWVFSRVDQALIVETLLRTERFGSTWSKAFWVVKSVSLTGHRWSGSGLVGRRGGSLRRAVVGGLEGGSSRWRRPGDRGRQSL